MARLRGRYLICFYCGKRSAFKYDGHTRDFTCTACDATNYLDEDGEITDPPVVESVSTKQYAAPLPSAPTDSIFCNTCLKNQRLFTASLAQYLPDDPSHPEYAELERKCYRFRKDLERRYPQVCAGCAEKVEGRIKKAGYTAKTDHLRRMMDRSRGRRGRKTVTPLDLANTAGRWLWWGGLVVQMLWHLVNVARTLKLRGDGMYDPDDQSTTATMIAWLNRVPALLPAADALIRWSIAAGFLSVWWNPHFVQVNRGFTRHLLGFTQWYSFQGLIIFFRYLFRSVLDMQGGKAQSKGAQLSAHLTMAGITSLTYMLARRSIRVDTTPLFGPSERTISTSRASTPTRPVPNKTGEPKTLAEALTEALDSTNTMPHKAALSRQNHHHHHPTPLPRVPNNPRQSTRGNSPLSFGSLGLSDRAPPPTRVQQVQDPDEMDWSPIPNRSSSHRAFQETPTSKLGARPFGQPPAQPDSGAFWYKVPAAPVNPAHRLRNPPNAPLLRQKPAKPAEDERLLHFRSRRAEVVRGVDDTAGTNKVNFKNPSFFAPQQHDEADALADAFGQRFSVVGREQNDEFLGGRSLLRLGLLATPGPSLLAGRPLAVAMSKEARLAVLLISGIIAMRGTGEASGQERIEGDAAEAASPAPGPRAYIISALGVAELSAVCWAAWQLWTEEQEMPWYYGAGILGFMLGHQAWWGYVLLT